MKYGLCCTALLLMSACADAIQDTAWEPDICSADPGALACIEEPMSTGSDGDVAGGVALRDLERECKEAVGEQESRNEFCRSLSRFPKDVRRRCWDHTNRTSNEWSNWCHNEFGEN